MNGGKRSIGIWPREVEGVAPTDSAPAFDDLDAGNEDVARRDWRAAIAGALAVLLAGGWLTLLIAPHPLPHSIADSVALIRDASMPLALIALLYLIAVRASRSEATRFGRLAAAARTERGRLDASMAHGSLRLAEEQAAIADHADRLMTIGEATGERLRALSDKLRFDIDVVDRQAETLKASTGAACRDMAALLGDVPQAQLQTLEMTRALEAAGLAAHERAGALDAQIAALVARAREADEVAGGAAQKLAAHLARVEHVSETAGGHLVGAAETMTSAIDAALGRAAAATDAARQGMEAQGAAMLALVEQGEAAIARTGAETADAVATRVADVTNRIEALGMLLAAQGDRSATMFALLDGDVERIGSRFENVESEITARHARLIVALATLGSHAGVLATALERGGTSAEAMIGRVETLLMAFDGAAREIDETLPGALDRLDQHADASRSKIAELAPQVAQLEQHAASALDRLFEAEGALEKQRATLDGLADDVGARLRLSGAAAADLVAAVEGADARTRALADGAGTTLIEAMVRVREAGQLAAERAREALASVVPDSADRLATSVRAALQDAVAGEVDAQVAALAGTAERAVAAANAASDRLMRQMLTIAETSAQVEVRIADARSEIEDADRETFARRVALLIESLNSTAIDVGKVLSNDVTDSAWSAYLKGDRGVFTRRAVRLLDAGEAREVLRHYNDDPEFRDQVNRYVHDFEAMLRNVLATRAGSPLGVTLLSSDMGKLYVALAQAIERLRG